VIHYAAGTDDDVGPVYHYYMGRTATSVLNNDGEPIVLFEDTDSTHSWTTDTVHDFMMYEGPLTDADLATLTSWAGWPSYDNGRAANAGASLQLIGEDMDNQSTWYPILPSRPC